MKTKHTPGPWIINEFAEIEAGNGILGKVYCGDMMPAVTEETGANAKLIAAAPELLDALQYVVKVIENMEDAWWIDVPGRGGFDLDKIESAIKKATE